MLEKIKKVVLAVFAFASGFLVSMLFRSRSDRLGGNGDAERDGRIQEGIGRAEGHIERAEGILRNAIERSKSKDKKVSDSNESN